MVIFWDMSDVHECLSNLQIAHVAGISRYIADWKFAYNWLVLFAIDFAVYILWYMELKICTSIHTMYSIWPHFRLTYVSSSLPLYGYPPPTTLHHIHKSACGQGCRKQNVIGQAKSACTMIWLDVFWTAMSTQFSKYSQPFSYIKTEIVKDFERSCIHKAILLVIVKLM